jgi:hypothetical protein
MTDIQKLKEKYYGIIHDKDFSNYISDQLGRIKKAVKQASCRPGDTTENLIDAAATYGADEKLTLSVASLIIERYFETLKEAAQPDQGEYATTGINSKEYYAELYNNRMTELVEQFKDEPGYDGTQATYEFDETCNAEQIVGFYVVNEGDNALNQWLENIEGIDLTEQDLEVTRILKGLYSTKAA